MGCDGIVVDNPVVGTVSIHAPAWGATISKWSDSTTLEVSIHAPAWGATMASAMWDGNTEVSIHAPAWGATVCVFYYRLTYRFNPRTRMGCDAEQAKTSEGAWVSIHAPAWGATLLIS